MAKAVKKTKKTRRLKRQVRKTLGTLFLVSALVVAAIPVDGLQAAEENGGVTADNSDKRLYDDRKDYKVSIKEAGDTTITDDKLWAESTILDITDTSPSPGANFSDKVYTTEDLVLRFAITNAGTQTARAYIIGYDSVAQSNKSGDKNTLEIPRFVDAYTELGGYSCAVTNAGHILYWREVSKWEEIPRVDADGKPVLGEDGKQIIDRGDPLEYKYHPCYFSSKTEWEKLEAAATADNDIGLFFRQDLTIDSIKTITSNTGGTSGSVSSGSSYHIGVDWVPRKDNTQSSIDLQEGWIRADIYLSSTSRATHIAVTAVANQYVEANATVISPSTVTTSSKENGGVFSGASVPTVRFDPDIPAIGNYAFVGSSIGSLILTDSIKEVGNSAFSNCSKLSSVTVGENAQGVVLGDHAFYNCVQLGAFDARGVAKIGDSAFEGCTSLNNFNLVTSADGGGALQNLGYYAFAFTNVREIIFPAQFQETIMASTFEHCESLVHIYATGGTTRFNIGQDSDYSFKQFLEDNGHGTFYFEGARGLGLEETAVKNYFVYKYANQNIYRKIVPDTTSELDAEGYYKLYADFTVQRIGETDDGETVAVKLSEGLSHLDFPGRVGPLSIRQIGNESFADTCSLRSVNIPSTITRIGDAAFKGCHNLKSVIFEVGANPAIGTDAFRTQVFVDSTKHGGETLAQKPELYFTGEIGPEVSQFNYAMAADAENKPVNVINNSSQPDTTIVYYSGWPQNLTVECIDGKATLTNYPTIQQLMRKSNALDPTQGGTAEFTTDHYPYMTEEQEAAAYFAFWKYFGVIDDDYVQNYSGPYEDYLTQASRVEAENLIVSNTLTVNVPEGVVAIKPGLFAEKERDGDYAYLIERGILNEDAERLVSKSDPDHGIVSVPVGKTFFINFEDIAARSFADCKMLETVNIQNGSKTMGDNAFEGCVYLETVNIAPNLEKMGEVPFFGCKRLENINFNYMGSNQNFVCDQGVLYGRAGVNSDGAVTKLIEYLAGADYHVIPDTVLERTTEIGAHAFEGTDVEEADFSKSTVETIPQYAFANTPELVTVTLPNTAKYIDGYAFQKSAIRNLRGASYLVGIESSAFDDLSTRNYCTFWSAEGTLAERFSNNNPDHPKLKWQHEDAMRYYTINFYYEDEDGNKQYVHTEENKAEGSTIDVNALYAAGAFDELPKEIGGQVFKQRWLPVDNYTNITGNNLTLDVRAVYGSADSHNITFLDKDNNVIWSNDILVGGNLYIPSPPAVAGMTFTNWESVSPGIPGTYSIQDIDTVAEDLIFRAVYTISGTGTGSGNNGGDGTGSGNNGGDGTGGNGSGTGGNGTGTGGNGTGGNGSGTGGNGTGSNNGTGSSNTAYYTLTVRNGSGSGSYVQGAQAIVVANDPAAGMEFSNWTVEPSGTPIASTGVSATVITMPAGNVTVTANYKAKSGSSVSTGTGTTGSRNSSASVNTGTVIRGGTTVIIDKNGLSNTGVVAATVNGSSDNFVIKITESSAASEAAVRALMTEYGDLTNIKYFPMDISLYDSTGNNKITDTTGLSVTITLPLPDSLITYAGNNQIAGVVNDRLDKLTPRFTTISGVSCITFTAEHFSPYVIYVDTAHLSQGTADSTPKTGDGIHPKWFLSVGLACVSMVFFMKKDRKPRKRRQLA
ncbi:MAG: leucine-rich repeat protein [Candidatus Gastranaerophilales bacterium]|nr:leucine-rich repeat protein [Candidatus Gastranaerophilales bacterium]